MAANDLFQEDSALPEIIAIIIMMVILLSFFSVSSFLPVSTTTDVNSCSTTVQSTKAIPKNIYVLYGEGAAVILGACIIIYGVFSTKKDWEEVDERNRGLHFVMWGLGIMIVAVVFNIIYTLFL